MQKNKRQSYQEAVEAHRQVEDSAKAIGTDSAKACWESLVGLSGVLCSDPVASAIELTIDPDNVTLLRQGGGIPAAFALRSVSERLGDVDLTDDLAVRTVVNQAWQDFEDRKALANDVREGFGWDLSPSWMTVRKVADDRYRARLVREIATLAGRMYKAMRGVKVRRVTDDPQEVKEVTIGGDLERLLASEHAQLADADLGDLTAIRVMQRKAMQMRMQGEAEANRGPLVIALDESGSMHDEWSSAVEAHDAGYSDKEIARTKVSPWRERGTGRNTWAKACAVALIRIAHEDNRMVRVVHFGTSTAVDECKPGDHAAVVEMACRFLSGGTDIVKALRVAVHQVGDLEKEGHSGADVVLVSDGEDHRGDENAFTPTLDEMGQKGIRLWTVGIAVDYDKSNPLRDRAARYIHVHGKRLTADAVAGLEDAAQAEPRRDR